MKRAWLLLAAFTALACGQGPEQGVIVEFRTDLRLAGEEPPDMKSFLVRVRDSQGRMLRSQEFPAMAPAPNGFLGRLGLVGEGAGDGHLEIFVEGRIGALPTIRRTVRTIIRPGPPEHVVIELNRECLGIRCVDDKTCVPSFGCIPPEYPPPSSHQRGGGPDCDCNSFFPLCFGARWAYKVWSKMPGGPSVWMDKSWSISQYAPIDPQKFGTEMGFIQFTNDSTGFLRNRWLTVDAQGRLWWRKDDVFDRSGDPSTRLFYSLPGKLRLDATHNAIGETWSQEYSTTLITSSANVATEKHNDAWAVVRPQDVPGMQKEMVAAQLTSDRTLCHERIDAADSITEHKYFCFVRGIGKVYETDVGVQSEEVLSRYDVPGCASGP